MRLLRKIKYWLGKVLLFYSKWKKILFNYIFPNIAAIRKDRIRINHYAEFNQKTLITGAGKIEIGDGCMFGYNLGGYFYKGVIELQPRYEKSLIKIGNHILSNNNLFICAANYVSIEDDTLIGQGVCIIDHEAHGIEPDKRYELGEIGTVEIGKNVWIGNNVTILKNTKIGANTIVAAGAVVSGEFPANVIIGGVPAKIIKAIE